MERTTATSSSTSRIRNGGSPAGAGVGWSSVPVRILVESGNSTRNVVPSPTRVSTEMAP